jgi:hypothetical protein
MICAHRPSQAPKSLAAAATKAGNSPALPPPQCNRCPDAFRPRTHCLWRTRSRQCRSSSPLSYSTMNKLQCATSHTHATASNIPLRPIVRHSATPPHSNGRGRRRLHASAWPHLPRMRSRCCRRRHCRARARPVAIAAPPPSQPAIHAECGARAVVQRHLLSQRSAQRCVEAKDGLHVLGVDLRGGAEHHARCPPADVAA